MHFSYNKLWKLLIDKNLNKKKLSEISGVSSASIAKLVKGSNVTTDVLLKICECLDGDISDIAEVVKDEEKEKSEQQKAGMEERENG